MSKRNLKTAPEKRGKVAKVMPTIEEQTALFLKNGGEIEQIPNGVSGQKSMAGPKHITLGNRSNK